MIAIVLLDLGSSFPAPEENSSASSESPVKLASDVSSDATTENVDTTTITVEDGRQTREARRYDPQERRKFLGSAAFAAVLG